MFSLHAGLVLLVVVVGCTSAPVVPLVVPFCGADAPHDYHAETMSHDEAKATGNLLVERGWGNVTAAKQKDSLNVWLVDAVCKWSHAAYNFPPS